MRWEMRKRIYLLLILSSLLFSASRAGERWKNWLQKVNYIITPFEKKVFLSLKTDEEREEFVKKFWLIRDPVPETPVNEFKIEYERRWEYVNSHFSSPGKRDGWKTDMGKIYLLLGKPLEIQHYETYSEIYPSQLWLYKGKRELGLPAYFYLIFYKKKGVGKYRLYNPSNDGPEELLTPEVARSGITRHEALRILRRISPELARASTSYLLSEGEDLYGLNIGGSSNWLLSRIFSIPETLYQNSLKNKAIKKHVETSEFLLAKKSQLIYSVAREDSGYTLSLALQPEKLTFKKVGETYKSDLTFQVMIHSPSRDLLFERTRILKLRMTEEQYLTAKNNPIIIEDIVPIPPGLNRLTVILKNSNDKSYYQHEVWVNVDANTPIIRILPSFRVEETATPLRPFAFEDKIILTNPSTVYKLKDDVILAIRYHNLEGQGLMRIERWGKTIKTSEIDFKGQGVVFLNLSASSLGVGKYKMEVNFKKGSMEVSDDIVFYISPEEGKSIPAFIRFRYRERKEFLWEMGKIFVKSGKIREGLKLLEENFPSAPNQNDYLFVAGAYIKAGKPEKAVETLKPFLKTSFREPKIVAAVAYLNMEKPGQALDLLKSIEAKDDRVYKLIGEAYVKLGRKDKALQAWQESLRINPAQRELKRRVAILKNQVQNLP